MDTSRWQRIEALFHELADLPPGSARDAALAARCGADQALAAEVGALLEHDTRFDEGDGVTDPHLGLRLGAYEVRALIARGGMAAVYEARRADETFEQRVAIKVMDLRLSDPGLVAQFRAERQILAALEHPSLTRLLDGGVTPLGEPYLVMEFVEGQSIDRYCDAARLDVPARLRLFADVCDGVAFAHRNLVLHRDLKPSNILVTTAGRVKVVDFGTATLLQPDRLATMSAAPLTPAYASPEQLTGGAVGTASDQYSLGLVLFELLTGASAFGERNSLMAAVERALAATTTTAPHAVVTEAAAAARQTSLAKLRRTLSGDLATILGKALAHAPAARYASVQHFADDLTRWTDGAAILGRPPSFAYQASRFVRRHWAATAVAGTLAAGLAAATAVSIVQARRAREQAARAETQAVIARTESAKATQMNRFLTGMLSSANPSWTNANAVRAGSITVRDVLDGASQVVQQELGATPEVEAEMRATLGGAYVALGALDAGKPHLERALALFRDSGNAVGVVRTQAVIGQERTRRGNFADAESVLRDALVGARLLGEAREPEVQVQVRSELATAIGYRQPAAPEALALLADAVAINDRYGTRSVIVGVTEHNLGLQLLLAGRVDEAERLIRESLRVFESLPSVPNERVMALRSLSEVMRTTGDNAEAERLAGEAVAVAARVYPPEFPHHPSLKTSWGRALVAVGQVERGRDVLLNAYASFRRLRPAGHVDLLGPLVGLGAANRRVGDLRASERVLEEARSIIRANPGVANSMPGIAGELGLTWRAMGRAAAAQAILEEAHAHLLRLYGESHPSTKRALARVNGATE